MIWKSLLSAFGFYIAHSECELTVTYENIWKNFMYLLYMIYIIYYIVCIIIMYHIYVLYNMCSKHNDFINKIWNEYENKYKIIKRYLNNYFNHVW